MGASSEGSVASSAGRPPGVHVSVSGVPVGVLTTTGCGCFASVAGIEQTGAMRRSAA
jgi:hypothetical protein